MKDLYPLRVKCGRQSLCMINELYFESKFLIDNCLTFRNDYGIMRTRTYNV